MSHLIVDIYIYLVCYGIQDSYERVINMPTIKDALDIIERLTKSEQESLKLILTSVGSVKALGIEGF